MTTGEVAARCDVALQTVSNWIKSGKLPAHVTPGGHHRIWVRDFERFAREHGMAPAVGTGATATVLVVDDNPRVRRTLTQMLEKVGGYRVVSVADGFEAGLEVLQSQPDLVLLDLFMPQLDGFAVCRRLKGSAQTQRIKILATSASPTAQNRKKALDCGADAFMAKPFRMKELVQAMERLLRADVARSAEPRRA